MGVNTSHAVLQCNTGHVLQHSLASVQHLYCSTDSWAWNPPVQHCVSVQFLLQYGNTSTVRALSTQYMRLEQRQIRQGDAEWKMEVIATILVGCLLVLSAIIAIFILHRSRNTHHFQPKAKTIPVLD